MTTKTRPRVTSLAPQFLVDDLARSITYYQKLGFTFGEPWDGFYAIGQLDGLELHLKEAPKNDDERRHRRANEHLDAAAGVEGIEAFHAQCRANGATIIKPLTARLCRVVLPLLESGRCARSRRRERRESAVLRAALRALLQSPQDTLVPGLPVAGCVRRPGRVDK